MTKYEFSNYKSSHLSTKMFVRVYCDKAFLQSSYLYNHKRGFHQIKEDTDGYISMYLQQEFSYVFSAEAAQLDAYRWTALCELVSKVFVISSGSTGFCIQMAIRKFAISATKYCRQIMTWSSTIARWCIYSHISTMFAVRVSRNAATYCRTIANITENIHCHLRCRVGSNLLARRRTSWILRLVFIVGSYI